MRKYFVHDTWTKVHVECGPVLAINVSEGSVLQQIITKKYNLRDLLPNTSTLLCNQICTGVCLCYCLAYRLDGDQNVKMCPLWKLETRAFASTADFICTFFLFLIFFFFPYFSCLYIWSIHVFEVCEMSSFHICFYVVPRLLGGDAIYAAINVLTFLSSITFKRETEQCSETPVNSCQMTLRRRYLFTLYLKMLSVAQTA